MAARKQLEEEATFETIVRRYIHHVNTRLSPMILRGQSWVRVGPATKEEFEIEQVSLHKIRFHRVGSLARIATYEPGLVELRSGRFKHLVSEKELLTCWILVTGERDWLDH